ncbi:hypothetical protein CASFOL_039461 [Castilleja foliolosa]|uniref:LOB domain-containing protein n=1 Tax=Castilleja foliolosa TaxID=1961234 RepID=A0ABD3BIF6_9LAMI
MIENQKNNEEPISNHAACAACKYQRKRCPADCILRRHFPASNPDVFTAVHQVFGVSNILKRIRGAKSLVDQDRVAKSLYWEATLWAQDPFGGPYEAQLRDQLRLRDEIRLLRQHINRLQNVNANMPIINNFNGNINYDYVNDNCNHQGVIIRDYFPNGLWDSNIRVKGNFGFDQALTNHEELGNMNRQQQQYNYKSPKQELNNVTWQEQHNCRDPKHDI